MSDFLGEAYREPKEHISLADVLNVSIASNGSALFTLGNATSGEAYTSNAILFNSPGVYSIPLPPGVSNSDGSFTEQPVSQIGAQAVCWVRNDQWIILSLRDTRTQTNPGISNPGEICIQAQGNTNKITLTNDGSITLSNQQGTITLNGNSSSPAITLGNGDDKVALASVVDANFNAIINFLKVVFPSAKTCSLTYVNSAGTITPVVTTTGPVPTPNDTGSNFVSTQ